MAQAERDLAHACRSLEHEDYNWACYASFLAAKLALRAVYESLGVAPIRRSVTGLLRGLVPYALVPDRLENKAKRLDFHYVMTRYPNFLPGGAPFEFYGRDQAGRAIDNARDTIVFCQAVAREILRFAQNDGMPSLEKNDRMQRRERELDITLKGV